jgi:copper chaperone NosL
MRAALVLILVLALGACREDEVAAPAPLALTEEAVSFFCQMNVLEHGGPKAQIHLEGLPAPIFFAQVRDGLAYLKSSERDARVLVTYVSDMGRAAAWDAPGEENWVRADEALFVIEAGVAGGMGAPEVVPFAGQADADAFMARYGGRIVDLDEIPDEAVIGPVDPAMELETPS